MSKLERSSLLHRSYKGPPANQPSSVDRSYPHRDPPLTDAGRAAAKLIKLPITPDLIIVSPMTRTIQTALIAFDSLIGTSPFKVAVQVWPDLREAHDANCNKGVSRAEMMAKFPQFDFLSCPEEWDHPPHTVEGATVRAETVRARLKVLSATFQNIALVTHRGFIAFMVRGERFDVCGRSQSRYNLIPAS